MSDNCNASYALENKKDGTPIDWTQERAVKIRIDKKFADMEKGIQEHKDMVAARRKLKQDQIEARQLKKSQRVNQFF